MESTITFSNDSYPDRELLLLIQEGNEQAFAILYQRHFSALFRKAFKRIPDEFVVKEIVQDVFLNLWTKSSRLNADDNIPGYLFATLRNKILHELRSRHTRSKYAERTGILYKRWLENNSGNPLEAKQLEEKINQVVHALSGQCREAFLLSRFENLSYKEIAFYMNISLNTVKKHITRALYILRKELSEYDTGIIILVSFLYCFLPAS